MAFPACCDLSRIGYLNVSRIFAGVGGFRIVALAAVCVMLGGCGFVGSRSRSDREGEKPKGELEIVIPVEAALPERGDVSAYYETTTRVEAEIGVDVAAEGTGVCLAVYAEEGDFVTRGKVLAELDKDEAEAALSRAEVQLRQHKTELERAKGSLRDGLISTSEYDTASFTYEQSVENLRTQRVQVENLTIRAPIDGVVTVRNIQPGMLVSSGTPAFSIVDPSSFMLIIAPPEKELSRLRIGQVAKVSIDALEGEEFMAKVRRINPGVDPATGTVKVVLDFDEETRTRLREAVFARVKLVMETHEDALLVPKEAIVEENARKFLFVVRRKEDDSAAGGVQDEAMLDGEGGAADKPGDSSHEVLAVAKEDAGQDGGEEAGLPKFIAERIEVTLGLEDSRLAEILSGLDDGDLVVTNGQHTLKPGANLKVTNATDEILSKAGLSVEEALAAAEARRAGGAAVEKQGRRFRHK